MFFVNFFLHDLQRMSKQSIGKILPVNELIYKYQNCILDIRCYYFAGHFSVFIHEIIILFSKM